MDERLQRLSPERRKAVIDKMTLEQKAEHGCLPDYLSIKEIADLKHPIRSFRPPDNLDRKGRQDWRLQRNIENEDNEQYKNDLIGACVADLLKYEGNIKGWEYYKNQKNPHPFARPGHYGGEPLKESSYLLGTREWRSEFDRRPLTNRFGQKYYCYTCEPTDCTLHKDEFKRYLQNLQSQWPVNGLLANWWIDEHQADPPKPETNQPPPNEMGRSGLLKRIRGEDAWYDLIDDTTKALHDQLGRMPNEAQVWGMMWSNPPAGYTITPGKDKGGDDCLNMPGESPLSRSAFAKRWKRYTKPPMKNH